MSVYLSLLLSVSSSFLHSFQMEDEDMNGTELYDPDDPSPLVGKI